MSDEWSKRTHAEWRCYAVICTDAHNTFWTVLTLVKYHRYAYVQCTLCAEHTWPWSNRLKLTLKKRIKYKQHHDIYSSDDFIVCVLVLLQLWKLQISSGSFRMHFCSAKLRMVLCNFARQQLMAHCSPWGQLLKSQIHKMSQKIIENCGNV